MPRAPVVAPWQTAGPSAQAWRADGGVQRGVRSNSACGSGASSCHGLEGCGDKSGAWIKSGPPKRREPATGPLRAGSDTLSTT
eukprot:7966680-Alexandrium_andersonii.AAC.1